MSTTLSVTEVALNCGKRIVQAHLCIYVVLCQMLSYVFVVLINNNILAVVSFTHVLKPVPVARTEIPLKKYIMYTQQYDNIKYRIIKL